MPSPPGFVANFDSATAMTMATAAFLRGEDWPALGNPEPLKPLAARANVLPTKVREKAFILGGASEITRPGRVGKIHIDDVADWIAEEYPERRYPAVSVGSSSGAGVYLNAALGSPWLPQTLLLPVGQRVHPDDPQTAMEKGKEPAADLLEANPDWQLHHMHDANQDRLMVRALTYFRVKRRRLGDGYERFIVDRLPPGRTLLLMECKARWKTTRMGDRYVYQHGAMGGATQEEFHRGSERVAEYLERYDSPVREWDGPEPDTESPEAEWGFEESLRDDVVRLARERRYRVRRVIFEDPDSLSPLVADLYRWWYRRRRIPANRLLISSFVINDPYWTLRTGSTPFWMKFNMQPSVDAVNAYLDSTDPFDEIHLMLFQHGVRAVGLPPKEAWTDILARARKFGRPAGADLDEFPYDFAQFAKYHDALQAIPARYPLPRPLTLDELDEFLSQAGDYEGVTFEDIDP